MRVRGIVMGLGLACLGLVTASTVVHAQIGGLTLPVTTPTTPTATTTTVTTTTDTTTTDTGVLPKGGATQSSLLPDLPTLGLGIATPVGPLTPFGPGASPAVATGALNVTATGPWTLSAADATTGSPQPGHMIRAGTCSSGTPYLASPLKVTATPATGNSSGSNIALGATATPVATGPSSVLPISVPTRFEQTISASEPLAGGCQYTLTVTFTIG